MKTIITSAKEPPLRRVLFSFLFGAAALCVVPANSQAANIQAPPDIVWVTSSLISAFPGGPPEGYKIAKYNADGTAINTNFIIVRPTRVHYWQTVYANVPAYLGGILVSGPILYVGTVEPFHWETFYYLSYHPISYMGVIATYDAEFGNVTNSGFFGFGFLNRFSTPLPLGMALSAPYPPGPNGGPYLYVGTSSGSISQIATTPGGKTSFISSIAAPYAVAVNGNVLYVTNNAQNSNGNFYISTYTADTGALIKADFIQMKTAGLYGLALQGNTLYVSVYGGTAPGVYTYKADTGQLIKGPFVRVNEPWGIAIGSPPPNGTNPTLYVVSHQDSAIYEFDARTGARLSYSITPVVYAPTNITVEPAAAQ